MSISLLLKRRGRVNEFSFPSFVDFSSWFWEWSIVFSENAQPCQYFFEISGAELLRTRLALLKSFANGCPNAAGHRLPACGARGRLVCESRSGRLALASPSGGGQDARRPHSQDGYAPETRSQLRATEPQNLTVT
jgi:hypothetical protein